MAEDSEGKTQHRQQGQSRGIQRPPGQGPAEGWRAFHPMWRGLRKHGVSVLVHDEAQDLCRTCTEGEQEGHPHKGRKLVL